MTGAEINMPAVARAALVSEPTAYRYFADLASVLEEALAGIEPDPAVAFPAAAILPTRSSGSHTPPSSWPGSSSIGRARSARSSSFDHRGTARAVRPGYRFTLIDHALSPLAGPIPRIDAATLEQLRRDLAVVISAEAVLTLTDLYGLDPDPAIASIVHTARLITEATLAR